MLEKSKIDDKNIDILEKHSSQPLTISELGVIIKNLIENNVNKNIKIIGELSSVKRSGKHIYTSIKDNDSVIDVIFWNQFYFSNKEGDKVVIKGKLNYYSKTGKVNFIGIEIEAVGLGELYIEYQKNYDQFKQNGFFDNKKDLPINIHSIGILTAKEGAALQDILYVLNKNSYCGKVYIYNCVVQGPKCPSSIVEGIKFFKKNKNIKIDILLISRGGGSLEDLIGFSDKKVIKAINKCKIYTISAVGHEVDSMLSDFVANYRAPTPSIAAEVISKQYLEKINILEELKIFLEKSKSKDF